MNTHNVHIQKTETTPLVLGKRVPTVKETGLYMSRSVTLKRISLSRDTIKKYVLPKKGFQIDA